MAQIFLKSFDQGQLVTEFFLFNRTLSKTEAISKSLKTKNSVLKNLETIPSVDFIFLGIKPQNLSELKEIFFNKKLGNTTLVSMLAGTSVKKLENNTNINQVVRLMPNTAIAQGSGCTTIFFNSVISNEIKGQLSKLLAPLGETIILTSEEALDKVTPVNGSATAIIFELASYMVEYLKGQNIESEMARRIVTSTFLGSAKLMHESTKSLEELISEVTSKGGSTIKALEFYHDKKLKELLVQGLQESYKRVKELGQN